MSNLQITARFKIHNGKLEEFRKVADQCLYVVKEKDNQTLQYDWYFDERQTECVVREAYPDSDALLAHLANIGGLFGQLLALGDLNAEVYGKPSEALMNATKGLPIQVYSLYKGLNTSEEIISRTEQLEKTPESGQAVPEFNDEP